MYLEYYNLKIKPFQITVDPKFLWLGEKHKEALATLRYGILDNRGFLLLTGEVGTGKTILINRLVSLLDIDTIVATLPDPDLESMDFYNMLADGFKMKKTFDSKASFLIHLRNFLHKSYEQQQQVLLIIDESQRLNHRLMEDIRVLSNIELHDRKLIDIFFVGQQEFNSILMTPQSRALAQRITVRYHIEPLNQNETGDYIGHRLKVAGTTKKLFGKDAVQEIYLFSGGIPRLINIICDHSLLTGYARGVQQINEKVIKECAAELRIPAKYSKQINLSGINAFHDNKNIKQVQSGRTSPKKSTAGTFHDGGSLKKESEQSGYDAAALAEEKRTKTWIRVYSGVIAVLLSLIAYMVITLTKTDDFPGGKEGLNLKELNASIQEQKNARTAEMDDGVKNPDTPDSSVIKRAASRKENANQTGIDAATQLRKRIAEIKRKLGGSENNTLAPLPLLNDKIVINFSVNSNEIESKSYFVLDQLALHLIKKPNQQILIKGYTDSSGASSYNDSVSKYRANVVQSYLVGKGVDEVRIRTFGFGSKNPIAPNDTIRGRQANRRVEIEISENN
ncbi:MAG: AAA family ATPase [Desulfobacteraceae bacterium]|nr:AAA family ATPase [Desulfobacteraceae bacterium]